MSEEHIKTIVIDPPLERLADEDTSDEPRGEVNDANNPADNEPGMPLRSWLT